MREKALWRLLYETAARAQEVLSLNVEDVDLENKRARVRSKGGDTEWLHLQSGSGRLLPRLIAGRPSGPLFLADRRPRECQPPPICARIPAAGGSPTAAPKSCSSPLQAGGRCTSSGTPPSPT